MRLTVDRRPVLGHVGNLVKLKLYLGDLLAGALVLFVRSKPPDVARIGDATRRGGAVEVLGATRSRPG